MEKGTQGVSTTIMVGPSAPTLVLVPTVPSSLPPSDSADPGLVRRTLEREEIRYLVVAGTTTLLYLSLVAGLLYLRLPYMVAILIAQVVIIGIAFPTYRR